jgi:hypothetical protein
LGNQPNQNENKSVGNFLQGNQNQPSTGMFQPKPAQGGGDGQNLNKQQPPSLFSQTVPSGGNSNPQIGQLFQNKNIQEPKKETADNTTTNNNTINNSNQNTNQANDTNPKPSTDSNQPPKLNFQPSGNMFNKPTSGQPNFGFGNQPSVGVSGGQTTTSNLQSKPEEKTSVGQEGQVNSNNTNFGFKFNPPTQQGINSTTNTLVPPTGGFLPKGSNPTQNLFSSNQPKNTTNINPQNDQQKTQDTSNNNILSKPADSTSNTIQLTKPTTDQPQFKVPEQIAPKQEKKEKEDASKLQKNKEERI